MLSEANLPAHTHTFIGTEAMDSIQFRRSSYNIISTYGDTGIFIVDQSSGDTLCQRWSSANGSNQTDVLTWTYTPTGTLSNTGSGQEFLPPYMTVYAWYRTA